MTVAAALQLWRAARRRDLTARARRPRCPHPPGLTQEAVDAMEPAISSLPGWEARASRGGASAPASRGGASGDLHTGAAEEAPAASACWLVPNHEPLISPAVANGAGAGSAPGSPAHTSLFSVPFKAPEPEGACGSEAEAE